MNYIKLNIGLENNPKTISELTDLLKIKWIVINNLAIKEGEFNGNPERTLVIEGETKLKKEFILKMIEHICKVATQESIAVKINGEGILVFNPEYKGERYEFNENFFINL